MLAVLTSPKEKKQEDIKDFSTRLAVKGFL